MLISSLKLPNTLEPRANKILMFDCLILLGEELGNYFDLKMKPIMGEKWLRLMAQERGEYNLTLHDPDFVIKEPLRSDSKFRQILPKSPSFYKNLDILRKIRNHIAHNKTEGGYEETREILQTLLEVSMDIGLTNCANQYALAIRRIEALEDGQIFTDEIDTVDRMGDFERKSADLEEQLFEERARLAEITKKLEEARSVVVIKELELQDQRNKANNKATSIEKLSFELSEAQKDAEELRTQLEENVQRAEDIKKSEANLKKLILSLAGAFSNSSRSKLTDINDSELNFASQELINVEAPPTTYEIGTPWDSPKGNNKIVLSVSSRDLVETKNGRLLENADPVQTKVLAEKWLKIRPQGGRIFIDPEGHASTLIDDRLVYLGNVTGLFN